MKLNDILFEQDLFDQYKDKVSDAIKVSNVLSLWRGASNEGPVRLIDPTKFSKPRESQTGFNFLLEWTANDPLWKKFPARTRSVIAATDYDTAEQFGTAYKVLPFNGAKIVICPVEDFNNPGSFPAMESMVDPFDSYQFLAEYLTDFFMRLAMRLRAVAKTYPMQVQLLHELDKLDPNDHQTLRDLDMGPVDELVNILLYQKKIHNTGAYNIFANLLSPKANNYELVGIQQAGKIDYNTSHEVWTDSPCLLINEDEISI